MNEEELYDVDINAPSDFAFTKASFASYDEREVSLCVSQRRWWKKRGERKNQADTLFSPATWLKASRQMELCDEKERAT